MIPPTSSHYRTIRSFVCREGRMTPAQERAFDQLVPIYELPADKGMLDLHPIFPKSKELVLEIGFGMGASFFELAKQHPEIGFIGIEVHRPGIGSLLNLIHQASLKNVRIFYGDAVTILKACIPNQTFSRIQILFPDPWPKKRHHKRRLIQKEFLGLIYQKLKAEGTLHLATDCEDYAQHMLQVIAEHGQWVNEAGQGRFALRPNWRSVTKFERRGQEAGRIIRDIIVHSKIIPSFDQKNYD